MSDTRKAIEASPLGFHLCGSRFLGTQEPGSDWDYVVTCTPEAQAFLAGLGFYEMTHERATGRGYEGSYVHAVYEKIENGEKIQVSAELDSRYKMAIMATLKACRALRQLDQELRGTTERDRLWEALYDLAGFVEATKPVSLPEPLPEGLCF